MSHCPFCQYDRGLGRWIGDQDAVSRIDKVRGSADADWLISVVNYPNMQGTVIKAAQVRLRKLGRGAAA
jgi:hypothetical protein